MTSSLKSALPAHLKSALGNGDANAEFARKHHGKTQSHMVSVPPKLLKMTNAWHSLERERERERHPADVFSF